ncbi:CgeB family protein [Silvibacterium sp.]|uniref:CgeB family protein n=1 Tax=Silvibacterium sp. TaxID=1964179 RepID=UPI0039E5521D
MTSLPARRKVLYVADLSKGGTSLHRFHALSRIGQEAIGFDTSPYDPSSRVVGAIAHRFPFGPFVARINQDLRRLAAETQPDAVIFDKPVVFNARTIQSIRKAGAITVCYNMDNPFGPRKDACWRQYMRVFRLFDLNCAFRSTDIPIFEKFGLSWVRTMVSFEPTIHFPPPAGWSEADRTRELSYVGSPHEDRPEFLRQLGDTYKLPLMIGGPRWEKFYPPELLERYVKDAYLGDEAYRQAIWRSRVNLAFISHMNDDEVCHKGVEIAACGSFMLLERSEGHAATYEEDKEAVFFSSVEECADKARFYLGRPDLREAIGARARERAVRDGYDNDTQLARILNHIDGRQA